MALNVEHRASDSVHVERVWRAGRSQASRMLSMANSNWELLIARAGDRVEALIRGPETQPAMVAMPEHDETTGIVLAHGTAMPHLPVPRLVDSCIRAQDSSGRRLLLRGDTWELPSYENAEVFITRLARAGVITRDPLVADLAAGAEDHRLSARSLQRRVASVTGLTQGLIQQTLPLTFLALLTSLTLGIGGPWGSSARRGSPPSSDSSSRSSPPARWPSTLPLRQHSVVTLVVTASWCLQDAGRCWHSSSPRFCQCSSRAAGDGRGGRQGLPAPRHRDRHRPLAVWRRDRGVGGDPNQPRHQPRLDARRGAT